MTSLRLVGVLTGLGVACALILTLVAQTTAPRIAANHAAYLQKAVLQVVPGGVTQEPLEWEGVQAFEVRNAGNELQGYAVVCETRGFQDVIAFIYGYDPNRESVTGMKVLSSRETPGLGDKIEKDAIFLEHVSNIAVPVENDALVHQVEFVKPGQRLHEWQVDAISGATISSRAVVKGLSDSTALWVPQLKKRRSP
ncbi:MAG: FMN-binding protein [Acidobacteria bacterium]|nr:FMN-binding protein [Acidobacteriota bacterium]